MVSKFNLLKFDRVVVVKLLVYVNGDYVNIEFFFKVIKIMLVFLVCEMLVLFVVLFSLVYRVNIFGLNLSRVWIGNGSLFEMK